MGLLADAKKRQREKISKQFISFYDSVLYLGEPKDEAFLFIVNILENKGVYFELTHNGLEEVQLQNDNDKEDTKYIAYSMELTIKDLSEQIFRNDIDYDGISHRVGFSKKRFLEMLVDMGFLIDQNELINAQSPDLVFHDNCFEVDYYTYEMIVNERDELRQRLEHSKPTDSQLSQKLTDLNAQLTTADNKIASQAKEITDLRARIAELEANEASQSDTPTDSEPLHPRAANNASKIISALASELLGMDLTQPYADDTNGRILKAVEIQGNTLSKDTIAYWLRQAHEISK